MMMTRSSVHTDPDGESEIRLRPVGDFLGRSALVKTVLAFERMVSSLTYLTR